MRTVSIVVTYNGSKWINKCLQSLTLSNIPLYIIVVDNCSDDDTCKIINENFPQVNLIRLDKNLGFGKANNIGIKEALNLDFDFIFFLNQDAYVQESTIKDLIHLSIKNPQYLILSPIHLNGDGSKLDYHFSIYASQEYCENFYSDCILSKKEDIYEIKFVNAAMWLIPHRCFTIIGGFDPHFNHYGEDTDLINRIHFYGFKIGICPNCLGFHDRNQNVFKIEKLKFKNQIKRRKVIFLIALKNINLSFSECLLQTISKLTKSLLKSLINLDYKSFISEIAAALVVSRKIPSIVARRKEMRKTGSHYLN